MGSIRIYSRGSGPSQVDSLKLYCTALVCRNKPYWSGTFSSFARLAKSPRVVSSRVIIRLITLGGGMGVATFTILEGSVVIACIDVAYPTDDSSPTGMSKVP